jgi:hypothetical protein
VIRDAATDNESMLKPSMMETNRFLSTSIGIIVGNRRFLEPSESLHGIRFAICLWQPEAEQSWTVREVAHVRQNVPSAFTKQRWPEVEFIEKTWQ